MDKNKLKLTILEQAIFSHLCIRAGEKFSQRDIAKALAVSPTAVSHSIPALQENKLITLEKIKTIHLISFNRENYKAIELKRVENLKNIYLSRFSEYLEQELPGSTIFLFGSYSRGEDTYTSDIDIAVIERKEKMLDLVKYERIFHRKINVNFYSSWKDIHKHLKNNILNGILLHGGVAL